MVVPIPLLLPVVNGITGVMENRLRIMQVVNVRWFNATAWYGLSLSRLLKKAGHEVLVLALPGTESFARAGEMDLAPVPMNLNSANPFVLARALRRLSGLLKDFQPHIVNCHRGEGMIFWGMLKAMGHEFALIRTRGDQRPPKANVPNRYLHTRMADAVIATNSRTARQCLTLLSLPQERLYTILGGVDTTFFTRDEEARAAARKALGFAPDDLVVGLLGRFDPVKGQRELMEAFSRARSAAAPGGAGLSGRPRLMLMGFPASFANEQIEQWTREYGIADCTVLTGRVERGQTPACISAMDLGVVASQGSEAIARAAFEIMACGVPLIGTDVGVMPDLLPKEALVPPADPAALCGLLERAMSDVSFRGALQEFGRKRMDSLSEQSFLDQTLKAYADALQRRSGTLSV